MAIPTCFASYILTLHRLITREDIFKYARFDVVRSGHSIGCWGTFIESPRLRTFSCLRARLENRIGAPEI